MPDILKSLNVWEASQSNVSVVWCLLWQYDFFLKYVQKTVISCASSRSLYCFICYFLNQGGQIWGLQSGPYLTKWDKSGTFPDQRARRTKGNIKVILKSPKVVPFGANLAQFQTKSDILACYMVFYKLHTFCWTSLSACLLDNGWIHFLWFR